MHTLSFKTIAKYTAMACLPLAMVACDDDDVDEILGTNTSEVLDNRDEFDQVEGLLEDANLLTTLDGLNSFTFFAPNNAAITAAASTYAGLNAQQQSDFLLYHVINGATIKASDIGEGVTIVRSGDNSSPSLVIENEDGAVTVNDVPVVNTDIDTDNGVIHEISGVLMMPNVVNLATYFSDLTSLVSAVTTANLGDTLSNRQNITVFAPTNTAFTQTATAGLSNEQLAEILTYHVVPSVAFSTDLTDGMMVPTLQGDTLTINTSTTSPSGFTVSGTNGIARNIVTADVRGTNGVVHTIDGVLLRD